MEINPKYPVFIPTKNRYDSRFTIKSFQNMNIPFTIVIEKQEYEQYRQYVNKNQILVLPHQNKGLVATRNWIWDYAQNELKTPYFWTFDDNIGRNIESMNGYGAICRLNKNTKIPVSNGLPLKIIEDFTERYENLYITGMNYFFFMPRKAKAYPFTINTRIYSNMLIKTDIPFRNELFFNDDTDLCLRILKRGYCTLLFNNFLVYKAQTLTVKGGMTDYYNKTDKRLEFAKELQKAHPDVVKVTWKFNRWYHQVDYKPFRNNKLKLKAGIEIPQGVNNYGMNLYNVNTGELIQ